MPRSSHIPAPDGGHEARTLLRDYLIQKLGIDWSVSGCNHTTLTAMPDGGRLPHGSTRAAAGLLGMLPSQLSPYLTGKRRLTPAMRAKLSQEQPMSEATIAEQLEATQQYWDQTQKLLDEETRKTAMLRQKLAEVRAENAELRAKLSTEEA